MVVYRDLCMYTSMSVHNVGLFVGCVCVGGGCLFIFAPFMSSF